MDEELAKLKIERWGNNDNFVAPRELTITITLSEYRELVEATATITANNSSIRDLAESRLKEIQARDVRIAVLESQVAGLTEKLNARKII